MTDKTENPVLFRFKTVQTNAIRILFESLKNILSDVNFKADNTGLKLTTIDGTNSAIVNLFLQKEKFEEYIRITPRLIPNIFRYKKTDSTQRVLIKIKRINSVLIEIIGYLFLYTAIDIIYFILN